MKNNLVFEGIGKNVKLVTSMVSGIAGLLLFTTQLPAQCPGTTYCVNAQYSVGCAASEIDNVSFNTIVNNNTGCNAVPPTAANCTGLTTNVNAGSSYTISMQSLYGAFFGVWIDYNQDGVFNSTNEFVYNSPGSGSAVFTGTVIIPMSATPGLTRMRVRSRNGTAVSATEACTTYSYGETEDYGVNICFATAAPAVPGPIAGQAGPCANTTSTYSITPVTGATAYNWTPPAGATIATGQGTNSVSINWGVTGGNLTVASGNCFGASAVQTLSVTVNTSAPAAPGSVSGSGSSCTGSTGVYSITPVAGASSYTWTVPTGTIINSGQGTASINVTFGSTSGSISVTASNGCGTSAATSTGVTINAPPVISGLASSYCVNSPPSTLTGSPSGGTFSGAGISGSTFTPSVAGAGTHNISYATASVNYTVSQVGAFAPITGTQTPVTLTDDEVSLALPIGFSFNFYGTNYTNFYISSNGFITFNTASDNGCCSGAMLPNNDPLLSDMIAFCWNDVNPSNGGTIGYFTTGTAPNRKLAVTFTSVPYYSGGTPITAQVILNESSNTIEIHSTSISGNANQQTMGIENAGGTIATPVPGRNSVIWSATNDFVKFFPPSACNTTLSTTVNPLPVVSVNPPSATICSGNSTTLTADGANTYSWAPATGLNTTTGATVIASPSVTTTYTVSGTSSGCTSTATVTVTVNPSPAVSVSPSAPSICDGNSTSLTASGANTYTWSPATGLSATTGASVTANPAATTTYMITGTSADGCANTSSVTVTVNAAPAPPNVGSNSPVCEGGPVNLTADPIAGATYSWTGPNAFGSSDQNPVLSNATTSMGGTYSVTITVNGCTSLPSTVNMIINSVTPPTITPTATSFCDGDSVVLSSSPAMSYLWSNGATTQSIWVSASGSYSVTTPDANGCTGTSSIAITENANPVVTFAGLNSGYCLSNSAAALSGNPAGGTFTGPGISGNTFDPAMAGTGSHTIMYAFTDANGCSGSTSQITSVSTDAFVNLGPDTTVCGDAPPFILNAGTFSDYTWQDNSTNATFTVDAPALGLGQHTLYVNVTDANGCTGVDSFVVVVDGCLGISEVEIMQVSVSPNPTDGIINVIVNNYQGSELEFMITNIAGQVILEKKISHAAGPYSGQLDVSAFAKGIYYLEVSGGSTISIQKIALQ